MRHKKQWGRWTYDPTGEYPSLDIPSYGTNTDYPYQIRLFPRGCEFPKFTEWLGHWVQHLQDKGWIAPDDLWHFVDASHDLYVYQDELRHA